SAKRRREHQARVLPRRPGERRLGSLDLPVGAERGGGRRAEGDDPLARVSLQGLEHGAAPLEGELLGHVHLLAVAVDVDPAQAEVAPSRALPPGGATANDAIQRSTTSAVRSRSRTAPSSGMMWPRTAHWYWARVLGSILASLDGSQTASKNSPSVSSSDPARP